MEYNKIIAVTGLPGLYELLSSKSDGAIVRSLDDKSTRFVSSRIHNFSHLESIEVYTVRDNVNLVDILKAMEASADKLPDEKDAGSLKNYFTKVFPDLDFSRVYSSDLKKMVKWYSVLKANNIEIKLSEPEEETADEVAEDVDGLEEVEGVKGEKKEKAKKPVRKEEEAEKAAVAEKPAAGKKAEAPAKKATAAKAAGAKKSDTGGAVEKPKKAAKKSAASEADKPKKAAKKK
jgi:hypothetical protein